MRGVLARGSVSLALTEARDQLRGFAFEVHDFIPASLRCFMTFGAFYSLRFVWESEYELGGCYFDLVEF